MVLKLSEPPDMRNGNSTAWTAWGDELPKVSSGCLSLLLFLIILFLLIWLIRHKVL
jgi:hypothetical protein